MKFTLGLDELDVLVKHLPKDGIILLVGDLASGKTTLTKHIVSHHKIDQNVTSPTFSVMQSYIGENFTIYHYDIYQNGLDDMIKNGLIENLFQDGLHIVEWGDERLERLLTKYELPYTKIIITQTDDARTYEVESA